MNEPVKITEKHLIEKASEILGEARRLGYFKFKCHLQRSGSYPLKLSFANNGSIWYGRQLGWAQFFEKNGGIFTGADQGTHFQQVVQSFILSSDGIEPRQRGITRRSRRSETRI